MVKNETRHDLEFCLELCLGFFSNALTYHMLLNTYPLSLYVSLLHDHAKLTFLHQTLMAAFLIDMSFHTASTALFKLLISQKPYNIFLFGFLIYVQGIFWEQCIYQKL